MKRISLALIIALLIPMCLSGCVSMNFSGINAVGGKGEPEIFSYEVGDFTKIDISIYCNVEYYSGDSKMVTLEIQPNLVQYIQVENIGGILILRTNRDISWSARAPVLTVRIPELERVAYAGAGMFTAHDRIETEKFSLTISGAGSGKADVLVDELYASLSGAGNFELSGEARSAEMELSGAGSIDAISLKTENARVTISGVGSISVSCSELLRVNASGLGTVEYAGSPRIEMTGGGLTSVKKVG